MPDSYCLVQTGEMISMLEDIPLARYPLLGRDRRQGVKRFERCRSDAAWPRIRNAPKLAGVPTEETPENREVPAFSHFSLRPRLSSAAQRGGLPYAVFILQRAIFIPSGTGFFSGRNLMDAVLK